MTQLRRNACSSSPLATARPQLVPSVADADGTEWLGSAANGADVPVLSLVRWQQTGPLTSSTARR